MVENLTLLHVNNKGADQPLISHFLIRFLENIIFKLATVVISIFYLVSVAEETGLSLTLSYSTLALLGCKSR